MATQTPEGIDLFVTMIPEEMRPHLEPMVRLQYESLTPDQQAEYSRALPAVENAITVGDFAAFQLAITPLDDGALQMAPLLWSFVQESRRK